MSAPLTLCKVIWPSFVVTPVDFGTVDEKGRTVGVIAKAYEADFIARDDGYGYTQAPGHYFSAYVSAARAGEEFGASQNSAHFKTARERDAFIARRVSEARARYAKKYAVAA